MSEVQNVVYSNRCVVVQVIQDCGLSRGYLAAGEPRVSYTADGLRIIRTADGLKVTWTAGGLRIIWTADGLMVT